MKRLGLTLAMLGAVSVVRVTAPLAAQDTAARAAAAAPSVDTAGAPVVFRGDTLLWLYGRLGAFTPAERADGAARRIGQLSRAVATGDSIVVVDAETHSDLIVGETVLFTVLNVDATPLGRPRPEVARSHASRVATAMQLAAKRTTLKAILLGALFTVLATAALVAVLKLMSVVFPRIVTTLNAWRHTRIPSLRIQRLEILSATRLTDTLVGIVRILRVALVVVLLYLYVPLVLSFFPWTEPLANRIVGYVVAPLGRAWSGFTDYLPNVFFIAVIVFITYYVLKFVRLFFDAIDSGAVVFPGFYREWSQPTYKIARFLVLAFVVVVIFPYLPGAGSDAFKGVSLFLGALFTLGSSSAIANIVAGTVLTYTRAFQIGDRVKIGETTGDVMERTLLVTRIRTIKNVDITIPNAMVLSSHITNYSTMAKQGGVILHTGVTIGYDVPWRQVHDLLIAAAKATDGIIAEPAPFVLQTSLDDFYVSYQLNAFSDDPSVMARTYSVLHQNIQDKFNEAGVEIMSPHYRAARDGNQTTIPADYLPKEYVTPSFRLSGIPGGGASSGS